MGSQFTQASLEQSHTPSTQTEDPNSIRLPRVNPARVQGDIAIGGSSNVYLLSETIASFFSNQGYTGTIQMEEATSGLGFEQLCEEGTIDIANASRPMTDEEANVCLENERQPIPFEIGTDALVVVVNPANTFISDATVDEIAALFTAERWSDVNPDWPARDILRFAPNAESGTFDLFVEKVFAGDGSKLLDAPNTDFSPDLADQVLGVVTNRDAISFLSHGYYLQNSALVKPLSIAGIEPMVDTVKDEAYPLTRPLYMYSTTDVIQEKPQVGDFISFYLTRINSIIEQVGFFPATTDRLNETKNTLMDSMGTTETSQ